MYLKLQNLSETCENIKPTYLIPWRKQIQRQKERPIVIGGLILLKIYTTFIELLIKNTLAKSKAIFVLMEGFHLSYLKEKSHYRSSHRSCSERGRVLRNFAKSTGKHLYQNLFFNKVAVFSLWKEKLWHRYFLANFVKFLRTPFSQNRTLLCDCFCHYEKTDQDKVPFSLRFISLKKILQCFKYRKKMFNAFYV